MGSYSALKRVIKTSGKAWNYKLSVCDALREKNQDLKYHFHPEEKKRGSAL